MVRAGMTEADMIEENPQAWAMATAMVDRLSRGDKVLGYNLMLCECHPDDRSCGHSIELVNWDMHGADWKQPEGFYCDSCQRWCNNAHGDSISMQCAECSDVH